MVNCEGWTCPTCRRNYAPWMPSCNCINSAVGVNTTLSITPHADDTAELVELLARMTYTARILHQNTPPAGDDAEVLALITAAEAALARCRGVSS